METSLKSEKNSLHYIHFYLGEISYYNNNFFSAEESVIEDWGFLELLKKEWGTDFLSDETFSLLQNFRKHWLVYKNEKFYSGDPVFMSIDVDWKDIVKEHLKPCLESMEIDLTKHQIEFLPIMKSYKPESFPPIEAILQRGHILHKLLIENKIITQDYLDE